MRLPTTSAAALLCVAIPMLLQACATEKTITQPCPPGTTRDPIQLVCRVNGSNMGDASNAPEDSGVEDTGPEEIPDEGGPTDPGGPPDTGPAVAEDVEELDIKIDGQCNPAADPMNRRIGMPCTDHAQCETCYCYDEAYLAPFRFCTIDCFSGTGTACSEQSNDPNEYVALNFKAVEEDYGLHHGCVCMPACESDEECKIYAPDYVCTEHAGGTLWDGHTLSLRHTCTTWPH